GMGVLDRLQSRAQLPCIVVVTAHGSERIAVEAMKKGAWDYLAKPYENEELRLLAERALERLAPSRGNRGPTGQPPRPAGAGRGRGLGGGAERGDPRGLRRDREGRRARRLGPRLGRERHRQGARRPRGPRSQPARERAVRRGQLRGPPGHAHRERALRPPEGRV